MSETADSQMFFSCDGFEAGRVFFLRRQFSKESAGFLEAMRVENEARLQQVHQDRESLPAMLLCCLLLDVSF